MSDKTYYALVKILLSIINGYAEHSPEPHKTRLRKLINELITVTEDKHQNAKS